MVIFRVTQNKNFSFAYAIEATARAVVWASKPTAGERQQWQS